MKKLTMLAAMLGMMLFAAVPAFAQTTIVDNSENEIDSSVEDSFNGNNVAINDCDQVGGNQTNINGDGNVNINEQDQSCDASAGDVFYDDYYYYYPYYLWFY